MGVVEALEVFHIVFDLSANDLLLLLLQKEEWCDLGAIIGLDQDF